MACLFIVLGAVALWDTTNMMDSDSSVFPRAIAIAMILLSLLLIVQKLVYPLPRKMELMRAPPLLAALSWLP